MYLAQGRRTDGALGRLESPTLRPPPALAPTFQSDVEHNSQTVRVLASPSQGPGCSIRVPLPGPCHQGTSNRETHRSSAFQAVGTSPVWPPHWPRAGWGGH